jgi:hypothetical protein
MTLIKSYWTVKGISANARDAAIRAAEAEGTELGDWLSRLIGKVSEEERKAAAAKEPVIDTAAETADDSTGAADDPGEETAADAREEIADDTPEDTGDDAMDDAGEIKADKLSSIERAMLQARTASDA